MSSTFSPGFGASASTGKNEQALCSMYCPPKYSGVAPIGTFDSVIFRPTFDQSPTGSSSTRRAASATASSFLRALRVLVRMVTGLSSSIDSRNAEHSCGENRLKNISISSLL